MIVDVHTIQGNTVLLFVDQVMNSKKYFYSVLKKKVCRQWDSNPHPQK